MATSSECFIVFLTASQNESEHLATGISPSCERGGLAAILLHQLKYLAPMIPEFSPSSGLLAQLPLLRIGTAGALAHVRLNRAEKRNAISDALIAQLHTAFVNLPPEVRAVVLSGDGEHFCAGLDLSELVERDVAEGVLHSRMWHAAFDAIQFGRVPVIAVLHGAVVGGGLELAASCHVRVAEASAYFGLPEGQRGLFVGGGGSARIPRLMGVARMSD